MIWNCLEWCLKGERWKELKGYEGYYQVSRFGRVRSVDRYIPHPRLNQQFVKGVILKQKVIIHRNLVSKKPSIDLQVALSLEGTTKYYNVRRLVYATFVQPSLDYEKDGLYVINVNGNGYDCRVANLKLVTKSEKALRSFKRGRVGVSYLKTADRSKWKKPYGGMVRRKPINQYSISGQLIKRFESISAAAKKNEVGEKEIINVAKGRWQQYNGFIYKYSNQQ